MAYYTQPKLKDEEGQPQQTDADGTVKPSSSVISSAPGTATAGGNKPNIPVAPAPGTQRTFAGIQDYINANRGQTANLANQVGETVTGYGNTARDAIKSGTTAYNQEVDKNVVNLDEDVFNRAKEDPNSLTGGIKDVSNLQRGPSQDTFDPSSFGHTNRFTRNPENNPFLRNFQLDEGGAKQAETTLNNVNDLTTFLNMRDAQYKGPNSLEETAFYKPIEESVNKATTASEQAKSEEGNRSLLSDLQAKQTGAVNQGALALNQGLLRGDVGARSILNKASASNADLGGLVSKTSGDAQTRSKQASDTTNATRNAIAQGMGGLQGELEQSLNSKAETTLNDANTQTQRIINTLTSGGSPSDEDLAVLGVTPAQWHKLQDDVMTYNMTYGEGTLPEYVQQLYQETPANYQLDLSTYLQQQNPGLTINAQSVATPEDYARYAALNTLMGTDNSFLSDPSLANTANTDGIDLNINAAQEDLDNKKRLIEENRQARRDYLAATLRSAQK